MRNADAIFEKNRRKSGNISKRAYLQLPKCILVQVEDKNGSCINNSKVVSFYFPEEAEWVLFIPLFLLSWNLYMPDSWLILAFLRNNIVQEILNVLLFLLWKPLEIQERVIVALPIRVHIFRLVIRLWYFKENIIERVFKLSLLKGIAVKIWNALLAVKTITKLYLCLNILLFLKRNQSRLRKIEEISEFIDEVQ